MDQLWSTLLLLPYVPLFPAFPIYILSQAAANVLPIPPTLEHLSNCNSPLKVTVDLKSFFWYGPSLVTILRAGFCQFPVN